MEMFNGKTAEEWYSLYAQAVVRQQGSRTMKASGSALLACPFCGRCDLLSLEPHPESGFLSFCCRGCGCVGPSNTSETEAESAAHWNARQSAINNLERYWLFAGDCYYACGGMHDFCGAYESIELATQHAFYEWWHVWDTVEGKCVASSKVQPYNAGNDPPARKA